MNAAATARYRALHLAHRLPFRCCKQLPHARLALSEILAHNLRTVDDAGLVRVEHLTDCSRDGRLAAARRAIEEDASHVANPESSHRFARHDVAQEGSAHDGPQLRIQTANSVLFKVELWRPERFVNLQHRLERAREATGVRSLQLVEQLDLTRADTRHVESEHARLLFLLLRRRHRSLVPRRPCGSLHLGRLVLIHLLFQD
mmetsp:Transcript_16969/g.55507  ORF Transcript_16969/g.55507 Transcript_16969/m.55507 type:complete len:202 (+) Transcript_16969:842-1447(+)